jgi:hypothetical protein
VTEIYETMLHGTVACKSGSPAGESGVGYAYRADDRRNARTASVGADEPVQAFVAYEGHDPRFLETRPYTVCDAVMDAHAEAVAAGFSREDTVEHMAHAIRGAEPYSSGKRPAGRAGTGGKLRQEARPELWGGPDGRGKRGRLGHEGLKGYLNGS